jgi:hypothetical protein
MGSYLHYATKSPVEYTDPPSGTGLQDEEQNVVNTLVIAIRAVQP